MFQLGYGLLQTLNVVTALAPATFGIILGLVKASQIAKVSVSWTSVPSWLLGLFVGLIVIMVAVVCAGVVTMFYNWWSWAFSVCLFIAFLSLVPTASHLQPKSSDMAEKELKTR